MTIEEYVEKTKKELDLMEEGEWGDQELAFRFSLT